jgi:hypothetical protein
MTLPLCGKPRRRSHAALPQIRVGQSCRSAQTSKSFRRRRLSLEPSPVSEVPFREPGRRTLATLLFTFLLGLNAIAAESPTLTGIVIEVPPSHSNPRAGPGTPLTSSIAWKECLADERVFYRLTRDLHLYFGLFIAPFVLVFSVSVFFFMHARSPTIGPETTRVVSSLELRPDLAMLSGRPLVDALKPILFCLGLRWLF